MVLSPELDRSLDEVASVASRRAAAGARAGRLDPEVVEAVRRAGLFSLFVPPDLGGLGLGLPAACEVIARLSQADPAAGWAVMIGAGPAWFVGHMPSDLAAEVFGGGAAVAGSGAPGRADPASAGEGYRVTGCWRWCSGAPWAQWFTFAALVSGEEAAGPLVVAVPAAEVATDPGSWDVTGLRATASWTARLDAVNVPTRRVFRIDPDRPRRPEPLFRVPFLAFAQATMAAVAVGATRRALAAFTALARTKQPFGATGLLADQPSARDALGRATAAARTAERSLARATADVWQAAVAGVEPAGGVLVDLQLAATHAVATGAELGVALWRLGGMSVLDVDSELGRTVSDLQAVSQNAVVAGGRFADAGAALLGGDEP